MFFKELSELIGDHTDFNFHVSLKGETMSVIVIPKAKTEDSIKDHLSPMTISGTPKQIDEAFFEKLSKPIQKTAELVTNAEQYNEQLKKAEKESNALKKKKEENQKEAEKLYKKAETQIKNQKWNKAIELLQEAIKLDDNKKYKDRLKEIQEKTGQQASIEDESKQGKKEQKSSEEQNSEKENSEENPDEEEVTIPGKKEQKEQEETQENEEKSKDTGTSFDDW